MLVGVFKQKTPLSKIAGADLQATQVGQKLLTVIPNSYEPALELYLTRDVAVETIYDGQLQEQVGILQEYSDKFLLLSDVFFPELPEAQGLRERDGKSQFTVIFPRKQAVVRHAIQRHKIPAKISEKVKEDRSSTLWSQPSGGMKVPTNH
jgi:hypothetical protein